MGYLCSNFSLPRPLCSRLRPDVRDRQTDVRQTSNIKRASLLNASALWGGGIISESTQWITDGCKFRRRLCRRIRCCIGHGCSEFHCCCPCTPDSSQGILYTARHENNSTQAYSYSLHYTHTHIFILFLPARRSA